NHQAENRELLLAKHERVEAHILGAILASNNDLTGQLRTISAQLDRQEPGKYRLPVPQNWQRWQDGHKEETLTIFSDISRRIGLDRDKEVTNRILDSLHFPQMHERELGIPPAHAKTFE